jgi:acid phosphatase family membrane protein YuiD
VIVIDAVGLRLSAGIDASIVLRTVEDRLPRILEILSGRIGQQR